MNPLDNLTARARSTMSLLLIASLIAMWAGTADSAAELRDQTEFQLLASLLSYRGLMDDIAQAANQSGVSGHAVANVRQPSSQQIDLNAWHRQLERAAHDEGSLLRDPLDWITLEHLLARKQALYPAEFAGQADLRLAQQFTNISDEMLNKMRLTRNRIVDLEDAFRNARAERTETVRQMIERHQRTVRIPGFDLEFPADRAITLIGFGSVALMLYLLSTATTIDHLASRAQPGEGLDWLFFHHGSVGPVLGTLWLWLPALVNLYFLVRALALSGVQGPAAMALHGSLMLILGGLAWVVGRQVRTTRHTLHQTTAPATTDADVTTPRVAA